MLQSAISQKQHECVETLTTASREKFAQLREEWVVDIETTSSITRIIAHPCHLKIIAMGPRVIPLILESLKHEPNHWFAALQALTDENPVETGASFNEAVTAWLAWGQEKGYIDSAT